METLIVLLVIAAVIGGAVVLVSRQQSNQRELARVRELEPVRKSAEDDTTLFGTELQDLDTDTAGAPLDAAAAGSRDRLSVALAAQLAAITRHARNPAPVLADPDDDRHVDRSEAQDLHAWND